MTALSKNTVYYGPPGTAKTSHCISVVLNALAAGISSEAIGYVTFTRRGIHEALSRAMALTKQAAASFPFFKTLHALSFQLSGISGQLMNTVIYHEIAQKLGLQYLADQETDYWDLPSMNRVIFLHNLARTSKITYADAVRATDPEADLNYYLNCLSYIDRLMQERGLVDFTGVLERVLSVDTPHLEYLIVDEAQDLSILQWEVVRHLSKQSKVTVLAGDDDQSIFSWAGADSTPLFSPEGFDMIFLTQSFRVPKQVHKIASSLIKQVSVRVDKDYLPTDLAGSVQVVADLEELDMSQGQWLLLSRHKNLRDALHESLLERGYRVSQQGADKKLQAVCTANKLLLGGNALISEVRVMYEFMQRTQITHGFKELRGVDSDDLVDLTELVSNYGLISAEYGHWSEMLTKLSTQDVVYYRALERNNELHKEPRIRVSTIHGAKGAEADNVVVFTDINRRVSEALLTEKGRDDEIRLFYVAITRAKQNLYLIDRPSSKYRFDILGDI